MNCWLRRLGWMIVAIAAMILLAPIAASAHEGHTARPDLVRHTAMPISHPSRTDGQAAGLDHFFQHAAATTLVRSTEAALPDQESSCTEGCCFGMGCCGATIIAEGPLLDVPAGVSVLAPPGPERLASARLTSFLEPPKLLA